MELSLPQTHNYQAEVCWKVHHVQNNRHELIQVEETPGQLAPLGHPEQVMVVAGQEPEPIGCIAVHCLPHRGS
jgi:hypothetical protein